jgi:hypothetical protein
VVRLSIIVAIVVVSVVLVVSVLEIKIIVTFEVVEVGPVVVVIIVRTSGIGADRGVCRRLRAANCGKREHAKGAADCSPSTRKAEHWSTSTGFHHYHEGPSVRNIAVSGIEVRVARSGL